MSKDTRLHFTAVAWLKLLWMLYRASDTEVGGFAVCLKEPLVVDDIAIPRQEVQPAFVDFLGEEGSLNDYVDDMADRGLQPWQFYRIWIHTHPGNCATPSGHDEQTFAAPDGMGPLDWAVMFVLARDQSYTCRLRVQTPSGITVSQEIPATVGWSKFPESASKIDPAAWEAEFTARVRKKEWEPIFTSSQSGCLDRRHRSGGEWKVNDKGVYEFVSKATPEQANGFSPDATNAEESAWLTAIEQAQADARKREKRYRGKGWTWYRDEKSGRDFRVSLDAVEEIERNVNSVPDLTRGVQP